MAKDKTKEKTKIKRMTCCGCARNRNSDIFCEDPMLSDQQQYRYMTVDDMKSMGDDSMRVNVTDDERDNRYSATTVTDMITKENYHRTSAANLKPDNVDINRHPIHVGFLVSFLVDARGGAMRGCRHSGVRVIVPPRKAAMPMRVTCRYLKRDKLTNPPPLMEGEALASRILELGPVGAKFLGPVIIEVPHFASLRGKEREIVILRSDNGETWREHTLEASEEAVQDVLNESFEGEELSQLEDLQTSRIVRVLTVDFPHYFAVVSRIRQEVHAVGPEGGTVSSSAVPQVQAVFPPAALTKKIRVGLQAHPIPAELVAKLLGNRVAVSPIVTVEPRRRKFHKPIILTIPVPQAANKGMINQYSGDAPTLRLLCSITGGQSRAVWEDVTGSTPLTFVKDCVSFTTTVSARFWLMDCRNITEATRMATELYTHATHVPFMAKFVVFAKRVDPLEARLRVFCMTDDKEDKTLENQEHFTEVAKSRDVEVLEGKTQYMEFAGNLVPVMKSGEQLQLPFRAFKENRVPFTARVKDPDAADMVGRIMFMSEPKVPKGEPPQTPICTLNILLPEKISPEAAHSELDLLELSKNYSFLRDGGISRPDTIHRATIRLTDIANLLDHDWEKLSEELNVSPNEVDTIKNEHPGKPALQAATMLKLWQGNGNKATGNTLEKALNKIGREDIVKTCIFNVEMVTDDVEKAVARVRLDQPGFDSLKEELGPSRDSSLRRDGTVDPKLDPDYEEPDRMRDSESVEDLSGMGNITCEHTKQHITITNGTVFNGTSTPIKDKYASEEKELRNDMAEFIAHKCHTTDTMMKKSYDIPNDDNKKRQRLYEDANKLVTGVIQDAEKKKEKLAKEGWSGVYHDDARSSNEAEGVIGQRLARVNNMIITDKPNYAQSITSRIDNIEPLIIKKRRFAGGKDEPNGKIVSTKTVVTTQDDTKPGLPVITKTTTIREYSHPVTTESVHESMPTRDTHYFGANDPVIGLDKFCPITTDLTESVITRTAITKGPIIGKSTVTVTDSRLDEPLWNVELVGDNSKLHGQMVSFDANVIVDRAKENVAKSIAKVYSDCDTMLAETAESLESEKEKLSKGDKEVIVITSQDIGSTVRDETKFKPKDIKSILKSDAKKTSETSKPVEDNKQSVYQDVYNVKETRGDTKETMDTESKKQRDKSGGIFSGIFKGPKLKKNKSKDSRDASFDSGDEERKTDTTKFSEDTKKPTDLGSSQPIGQASTTHISVSTPIIQVSGPEYNMKNVTADFLADSRWSASVFHPELNEIKETRAVDANAKDKPSEEIKTTSTNEDDNDDDDNNENKEIKSKPGFFASFFRSSKPKFEDNVDVVTDDAKKTAQAGEEKVKKSAKDVADSVKASEPKVIVDAKSDLKNVEDSVKAPKPKVIVDAKSDLKNVEDDLATSTKSLEKTVTYETKHGDDFEKAREDLDKAIKDGKMTIEERVYPYVDDSPLGGDRAKPVTDKSDEKSAKTILDDAKYVTEKPLTTTIKTDPKYVEEDLSGRDKRIKDKPEIVKDGSRDSEDEMKEKSGGFFGMFKSPKSKKRSRSREKDSPKHESFDSGDEELRIATGAFLEDTRKASQKMHEPVIYEVPPKIDSGVKIGRFIASNETIYDTPKDKVHGTSYNVAVVKGKSKDENDRGAETLVTEASSATSKIIDKPEDPKAGKENEIVSKTAMKFETDSKNDVDDFEDSQTSEDGKEKSFFGMFKSPKLKSKKKSRSREQRNSKEPSFESGDEEQQRELKDATAKFLEDTRRTTDNLHKSVIEECTLMSDTQKPISPKNEKIGATSLIKDGINLVTESGKVDSAVTDVAQATTDHKPRDVTDVKEKGGIFGIFKSPKSTLKRRYKSREKIIPTDISFDSGDEDLKIATKQFLEDTRNVANASADLYKQNIEKDEKEIRVGDIPIKTDVVEKAPQYEPQDKEEGFFFGILKGAKHAVEDVSEDVKEFWGETKKEAAEEEKQARHATEEARKLVENAADETSSKILETKDKLKHKTSASLQKVVNDTVTAEKYANEKLSKNPAKSKIAGISKAIKEDIQDIKEEKDKISGEVEAVAETAEVAMNETATDVKKVKAKTGGFLSGIFKGTKHTVDEVSEDTKIFVERIREEATKKEKKVKQISGEAVKTVKDSDDISEKVKEFVDETKKEVATGGEKAKRALDEAAKNSKKKIAVDLRDAKNKLVEGVSAGGKKAIDQAKVGKEHMKESAISAKTATLDISKASEAKVVDTAQKAAKITSDTTDKLGKEITQAKDAVSKEIKQEIEDTKDKVVAGIETAAETADAFKDKVIKDANKVKSKTGGFLFGVFKGAKHSADEVTDDVKDFLQEVKQEAAREEEEARRAIADTEKAYKDEAALEIQTVKDTLSKGLSAVEERVKDDLDSNKNTLSDEAKTVGQKLSETAGHGAQVAIDKVHKLSVSSEKTGIEVSSDTAQAVKNTAEKETKKAKAKSGSFLSEIIKGAKHAVDEVTEFWDETKQEATNEEEHTRRAAEKIAKSVKDTTNVQGIVDHTKKTEKHAERKLLDTGNSVVDAVIATGGKVLEVTEKIVMTTTDAADKIGKDAAKIKATVSKEIKNDDKDAKGVAKERVVEAVMATGETVREITVKVANTAADAADKSGKDVAKVTTVITKEIKEDAKGVKDKVAAGAEAVAKTADAAKEKAAKDVKKAKEKAGGFLTGIFKGAKHAPDEVSEEVKEFVEDTKREAATEKNKVKHATEETAKAAAQIKDKVGLDTRTAKDNVLREITTDLQKVSDNTEAAEKKVIKKTDSAKDALLNGSRVMTAAILKVSEDVDKTKDAIGDTVKSNIDAAKDKTATEIDSVVTEKEAMMNKVGSFFSDIIKDTKHTVDDVSKEVQEFCDETKKEAAEKKEHLRGTTKETAKALKDAEDAPISELQSAKGRAEQTVSSAKKSIADTAAATEQKSSEITVITEQVSSEMAKKLSKDAERVKEVASKTLKDGTYAVKEDVGTTAEAIADTAEATKNKVVKSSKKAKAKGGNFLSGIFKGAKHTADESSADAREFLEETRREVSKEKEQAGEFIKHEGLKTIKDYKDKVASNILAANEKLVQETSTAFQKVVDATDEAQNKLSEETSDAAHKISDQTKATKEHIKDTVASVEDVARKIIEDKISELSDNIKIEKVVSDGVEEASTEASEHQLTAEAATIVDALDRTEEALQTDAKKAKTKSSGFLSGIIKGAKHAVDEVSEDIKEFWDETKQEASEEEQRTRRTTQQAAKFAQDSEQKVTSELHAAKDLLQDETLTSAQKIIDHSLEAERRVEQKLTSAKDAASDVVKTTREKVPDTTEKARKFATEAVEELSEDTSGAKDAACKIIVDDMKKIKDKVTTGAEKVGETADAAEDKILTDAKKTKSKAGGFLSGIFKGTKHASDEIEKNFKDLNEVTKQQIVNESREKTKHAADEVTKSAKNSKDEIITNLRNEKDKLTEDVSAGMQKVVDLTEATAGDVKEKTAVAKDVVYNAVKATDENIKDATDKMTITTRDGTIKLSKDVEKSKDIVNQEIKDDIVRATDQIIASTETVAGIADGVKDKVIKDGKKAKTKGGGFLSGIFKGAKSTVDDVSSTDVKHIIEETKKNTKRTAEDMVEDVDEIKQEVMKKEENAKLAVEEIAKSVKDSKDKVSVKLFETTDKLTVGISDRARKVLDQTEETKQQIKDTVTNTKDDVLNDVKITEERVSDINKKIETAISNAPKKLDDATIKVKEIFGEKNKEDTKIVKDTVVPRVDDAADIIIKTKNTLEHEEKKTKAKTGGFLSGIIKGSKYAIEEDSEDVKQFWDETEQEAVQEEEREHRAAEQAAKVKITEEEAISKIHELKDTLKDKTRSGVQEVIDSTKVIEKKVEDKIITTKDALSDAVKVTGEKISDTVAKAAKVSTDTAEKLKTGSAIAKNENEEDAKAAADKISTGIETISKSAGGVEDKVTNNIKKAKGKASGFLSGIFKGVKHAGDEVSEDFKEFTDNTKQKAAKKVDETENAMKEVKNQVTADVLTGTDKVMTETAAIAQKAVDGAKSTEAMIKENAASAKIGLSISVDKIGKEITDASSKAVGTTTEAAQKMSEDLHKTSCVVTDRAKDIIDITKEKAATVKDTVVNTTNAAKKTVEKETKEAKAKTGGFFSGVIKGAKHAVEDVSEEVKEFWDETKQEAAQEEEQARRMAEEATRVAKDVKNKPISVSQAKSKKLAEKISLTSQKAMDDTNAAMKKTSDKITSGIQTAEDVIKTVKDDTSKPMDAITTNATDNIRAVEDVSSTSTATNVDAVSRAKDKAIKNDKKTNTKDSGFLSGIFKSTKQSTDDAFNDLKEFVDETKEKMSREEDHLRHVIDNATKSAKQAKNKAVSDIDLAEAKLSEQVSKEAKEETRKLNAAKDSLVDGAKTTKTEIFRSKDTIKEKIKEDIKAVQRKAHESAETVADKVKAMKDQVKKEAHADKTKGGRFLSGIIKGTKYAVDEATEDVKEFWDETKQAAEETGGRVTTTNSKLSPVRDVSFDFGSQPMSRVIDSGMVKISDDISTVDPESDSKTATLMFLEDSRQTASHRYDQPSTGQYSESSASEQSSPRDSLERNGSPEESKSYKSKKSKNSVISSIVKGAKGATHKIAKEIDYATDNIKDSTVKFLEGTKQESKETFGSFGSYEVSSPLRETKVVRKVDVPINQSDVRLESFGPLDGVIVSEVAQLDTDAKLKSVSHISQKISPIKETKGTKGITDEKPDKLVAGVSSKLEHLEPRAHQTVTTVITKSVRTASTPPPSPAEFSDSSIKDVTEEAVKRAESLADQALVTDKSESDFMQHSEPTYMETSTTEIDPVTHERITRTTRITTTTTAIPVADSVTGGSDELRESMQKIMDQFLTGERRGQ